MATPKPDVPPPLALARLVHPDGRLTPEGQRLFLAWVERLNDHERRLAALEP